MPPQSRGNALPTGLQSKSTPNLPTVNSLGISTQESSRAPSTTSASETDDAKDNATNNINGELCFSTSEDSSEQDNDGVTPQQRLYERLYGHRLASRSYTHLPPSSSQLFPPFYNRPPTPLPPSPSLTSLLRPSLSRHTSRPTTPDSSDVDSISQTGTSATNATTAAAGIAKSARTATTVPRASPKVPTYEYYGFALYLASSAAFLLYVLWAYLPSPILHKLGIYYYPSRWWALRIPAWLVVLVMWIYVALGSYNTGYLTQPMRSVENLVDEVAQIAVIDRDGNIFRPKRRGRFSTHGKGHHHESHDHKHGRKGGRSGKHSRHNSATGPVGGKSMYGAQAAMPADFDWLRPWNEGTDGVMDVPIGAVNQILYGTRREDEHHE